MTYRGHAKCPLCGHVSGTGYFNARQIGTAHADAEHFRCSCGWVGVKHAAHIGQLRRLGQSVDEHTVVESMPGPGPQDGELSRTQLIAEVDRLKCELMAFAGVDTADAERLIRERDHYKLQADSYRRSILLLLDAEKHRMEAERCRIESQRLLLDAIQMGAPK